MDAKRITAVIRALISLCESGTYQCDTAGARHITQLIEAAERELVSIESEEEEEVKEDE